jgi:hypothetical protein
MMRQKIIASAKKRILFLPHAITQMSHPDRIISAAEVRETVMNGEIIEEYPNDARGEEEYLAIITAYVPATDQWSEDFRVRS